MYAPAPRRSGSSSSSPAPRSSSPSARRPGTGLVFFGGSDFKVHSDRPRSRTSPRSRSWAVHDSYVTGLALAGPSLVSGGYDGRLIWWDVESGSRVRAVDAHSKWIRRVAATPDGSVVASVADDMVCRLWDAATGQLRPRAPRPRRADAAPLRLDALRLRRSRRRPAGSRPATRSATSSSGTSNPAGRVAELEAAGFLHLGPGPATAFDRRHPRLAFSPGWVAAGRRRDRQDRQYRSSRQQAPDRGLRLAEGAAARRGPGRGPRHGRAAGVPPRRRDACSAPVATPTDSCSSATRAARTCCPGQGTDVRA